jgi:hypothetical protein
MVIVIPDNIIKSDVARLTNQVWKLLPMREKEEDWLGHLETLIIEIAGLNELAGINEKCLILLSKLEGLKVKETSFFIYRKTVFECISLLGELRL